MNRRMIRQWFGVLVLISGSMVWPAAPNAASCPIVVSFQYNCNQCFSACRDRGCPTVLACRNTGFPFCGGMEPCPRWECTCG